jgi:hypothetical protein
MKTGGRGLPFFSNLKRLVLFREFHLRRSATPVVTVHIPPVLRTMPVPMEELVSIVPTGDR